MRSTTFAICPRLILPALLGASFPASAQEWEVGGRFGYANNRASVEAIDRQFTEQSILARVKSDDGRRRSWSLYIDYTPGKPLSAQLGYADLGSANTRIVGTAAEVEPYLDRLNRYPIDNIRGSYLAAAYRFPLNDMVDVVTRGGLFYWQADFTIQSEQRTLVEYHSGLDPMVGVAVSLKLTRQLAGVMQWDIYTPDGYEIDVMTLGLAWRFR